MPKLIGRVGWMVLLVMCVSGGMVSGQDTPAAVALQIVFSVGLKPADLKVDDVRAAAEIVARRLEALEIQPYVVQVLAEKAIQVQIPAVDDPQATIAALSDTALLELVDFSGLRDRATEFENSSVITSAWENNPNLPPRDEGIVNPLTDQAFETVLTGADFVTAQAEAVVTTGQWTITFELTDAAGEHFGAFTEAHINELLAIVLDGRVLSIPIIQARLEKNGVISSNFTADEAKRLAAQLRAGALPLPLKVKSIETLETITP